MDVKKYVYDIINNIRKSNEELSKCLKKWIPLISSIVYKIHMITGREEEDIIQELLISIIEIDNIYDVPLYRYNGKLWEIGSENKGKVLLVNPRYNKTHKDSIWVKKSEVCKVKKGKRESSVYREINQQFVDIINAYFTKKNGFAKKRNKDNMVVVRSGSKGVFFDKRNVCSVQKMINFVDDSELVYYSNGDLNAEQELIYKDYINEINSGISIQARAILQYMIDNPGISNEMIAMKNNISVKIVALSRLEILRSISFLNTCDDDGYNPIYFSVEEICDAQV